ncbi:MAG: hypothetical protein BWY46_01972 [Firmicutes bacterium ADurb.Bin300]|nr:MAG: hypothetical protein BWY46_01972 [Firmicutes bacterium ADurb.Bin300]
MLIYWKITYIQNGEEHSFKCDNKMRMVHKYLDILDGSPDDGISSLKIWKDDTDYTATLNKFLYPRG